jgi:hypothetical protein
MRIGAAICLSAVAAWGCPRGPQVDCTKDAGVSPLGTSGSAYQTFCLEQARANLARIAACKGGDPGTLDPLVYGAGGNARRCASLARSVDRQLLVFADSRGSACLAALSSTACDREVMICDGLLTGTLERGAPCDLEPTGCGPGLLCDQTAPAFGGNCPSLCVVPGGAGAPCEPGVCAAGLGCQLDVSGGSACRPVVAGVPEGGPCARQMLPNGVMIPVCAPGTVCAGPAESSSCAKPRRLGDPCTVGWFQCDLSLGHCASDGRCRAVPSAGQTCSSTDTEPADCVDSSCASSGKCVVLKLPGERCGSPTECASLDCPNGRCGASPFLCPDSPDQCVP